MMYTLPDSGFHMLIDRGERHVLESREIPQSLCEKTRSITTSFWRTRTYRGFVFIKSDTQIGKIRLRDVNKLILS